MVNDYRVFFFNHEHHIRVLLTAGFHETTRRIQRI
jgi:hypothetical protein